MKRFSKILFICFAVIVALSTILTGCAHKVGQELLANGGFEEITSDNKVSGWEFFYFDKDGERDTSKSANYKNFGTGGSIEEEKFGKRYVEISTSDNAVAYLATTLKLYAGKTYALNVTYNISSQITSSKTTGVGGYFGFLESQDFLTINLKNTTTDQNKNSGWYERPTLYFRPTVTAKYTFVAGIGRTDLGGASGTIKFDNLSIKAVAKKDIPAGYQSQIEDLTPGSKVSDKEVGGVVYTVLLTIFSVAFIIGGYYLIRFLLKNKNRLDNVPLFDDEGNSPDNLNGGDKPKEVEAIKVKKSFKEYFEPQNLKTSLTSPIAIFIYTLIGAFLIRFILVMTVFGMGETMIEYGEIGLTIAQDGLKKLYNIHNTHLSTGWLYLLGLFGTIGNALDFTEKFMGMSMLIRIPNIIADLAVCYMIYKMLASNYNHKYSAVIAGLYALLPAMFTTSVSWGLNISIPLAFLCATINFMLNKKHLLVPIMYTLGLMFSNLMLIALPVVIGYEVFYCIKDKKAILPIVLTSIASFVVFYCLAIPFATAYFGADSNINGGALVFTKMIEDIKATCGVVSNSSFNFFAIFGLGNNNSNVAMIVVIAILMVLFAVLGGYLFSKTRNRLDFILLFAMSFLLWAVFGIGSSVEFTLIGVVLLLLYGGLKQEKRVFKAFGILATTNFVNTAVILTKSGAINRAYLDSVGVYNFYKLDPTYIIGSLITVATVGYLIWVMYDIMANGVEKEIKPLPTSLIDEFKTDCINYKNKVTKIFKRTK